MGVILSYVELRKGERDAFFMKHVLARNFNAKNGSPLFVAGYRFMVFLNFCVVQVPWLGATAAAGSRGHGYGVDRSVLQEAGGWRVMKSRDLDGVDA